ncbi:deoxyribodipyrimidine photolyase [Alteromonas aestuariivivens]|uniref:Deoxyribodipyrimidine photolyase n=1 Tax=Alteromonas aestuariivivens TaxID=1938339 RepID=A0A3D8M9A5_9ALTE|nr:FAD-binding domain-containing protein [Alteromonas aestuariivivens]RDV26607.1 deoxyribodipyrimidine photolyase [Alteromonas aestuariivivens]
MTDAQYARNYLIDYQELDAWVEAADPVAYAQNRNYLNGNVTRLSPFITHGILQLPGILAAVLSRFSPAQCERLMAEFAWREYFQYQWLQQAEGIFSDLVRAQPSALYKQPARALINASSGIDVIDDSVRQLTQRGYIHNHARLWLAFMHCHVAKTHWFEPARWLFYHLLDGDLASNFLSWQWVAGTSRNRIYTANQDNINKYSHTLQTNTFIDLTYPQLEDMELPQCFAQRDELALPFSLPESHFDSQRLSHNTTLCYSVWNLDHKWHRGAAVNRVLIIEPDLFQRFPISPLRWRFILHWANKIEGMQIFVGEFSRFEHQLPASQRLIHREHPTTVHWRGSREPRRFVWPCPDEPLKGFFPFWHKVKRAHQC